MINKNNKISKTNSITCTVIFDGSALNRDEKIGNSILSIKKLTYHGDIRPYISKNAIRHYLFNTLSRYSNWGRTPIIAQGSGDKQTLQLDLSKADIITFEELAVFGYMFTKSGESALTRKSPLGITKAIALSNYNQDLSFYANHDFVNRVRESGRNANPNPVNKEEHSGLFKLTFTLDADMIGKDSWIVDDFSFSDGALNIKIAEPQKFVIGNCHEKFDDDSNLLGYEIKEDEKDAIPIFVDGINIILSKKLVQKTKNIVSIKAEFAFDRKPKGNKFETKYSFKIQPEKYEESDSGDISFDCSFEPQFDSENKTLTLLSGHEKKIQKVKCESYNKTKRENSFSFQGENYKDCTIEVLSLNENKPENGPFKAEFLLSENKKKEIMRQLLFVIKNGLIAQSSNELNTIKPIFILAADVKVPMPVFHGDIDVKKEDDTLKVIGIKSAIDNGWLNGNIYLQVNERLSTLPINDERIKSNWDEFLTAVLPAT